MEVSINAPLVLSLMVRTTGKQPAKVRQDGRASPARVKSADVPSGSDSLPARLFIGALIMGIANRMMTGASNHHRNRWNLGISEWRALVALGGADGLIVRELAVRADLDYALASKSLKVLEERGLVTLEQTQTRGRATVVQLTPAGKLIRGEMVKASTRRQKRLLSTFTEEEERTLRELLVKLDRQIPHMNA
jgi:DNA-binding MarR family transcriptional regulator